MPTSFPTPLSPKDLKTDFSKVQSSAVSLETFRQTTMRDGDLLWTEKYVLIVKVLKEVFNDQLIRSVERILWVLFLSNWENKMAGKVTTQQNL